jgi:hypothetical protein
MTYITRVLPYVLIGFALVACSTPAIDEQPAEEFASEGLHPVSGTGFESAYVLPGANLPTYDEIEFDVFQSAEAEVTQTAVTGTTRRDWQITEDKSERLAQAWSSATSHAFRDYPRGEEGKRLRVEGVLVRVSPGHSATTSTVAAGPSTHGSRDVVNISAEFRIYDEVSGDLLAVVRDRQTIAALQWTRAAAVDMSNLFNSWAALLHTRISGR